MSCHRIISGCANDTFKNEWISLSQLFKFQLPGIVHADCHTVMNYCDTWVIVNVICDAWYFPITTSQNAVKKTYCERMLYNNLYMRILTHNITCSCIAVFSLKVVVNILLCDIWHLGFALAVEFTITVSIVLTWSKTWINAVETMFPKSECSVCVCVCVSVCKCNIWPKANGVTPLPLANLYTSHHQTSLFANTHTHCASKTPVGDWL